MKLLTFIFCFLGLMMLLTVMAWIIVEVGVANAKKEKAFNDLYKDIERSIDRNDSYDAIMEKLIRLGQMKWNREKCEVITVDFFHRYKVEATSRVS